MRWAGARSAAWPTCCRRTATWPTPSTAPRSRPCGACRRCRDKPGKTAVEMFQAAADGEIKALVDRLHQPRAVDARPGHGAPRAGARRVRRGAGSLRHHRHLRLRRPAAARHHLGREDRHRHQQRAPHQPRAPGGARARPERGTTGRSRSTSRAGSNASCAPAKPPCSPIPSRTTARVPKPSGTSTASPPAAATSTSPA